MSNTKITYITDLALLAVGSAASEKPEWVLFANYCFAREKGLKKEAFKQLDTFLATTQNWSMEQKIEFVRFIFKFPEKYKNTLYLISPHPLSKQIIEPTLTKWCETEKFDESPFRWYGTYYQAKKYLLRALEINPKDNLTRNEVLRWWTDITYYSIHHLPDGYLGNPLDDLVLLEEINMQINQLTDPELRDYWMDYIKVDSEIIHNYVEWKNSGHLDFGQWGLENGKRTGYNVQSYYFKK